VVVIGFELLVGGSLFPSVESPWPDRIGVGFPVAMAGAFGAVAGVIHAESPKARRERAMIRWGVRGFWLGALLYSVSLLVQVFSL
jgi:hypothetical protein